MSLIPNYVPNSYKTINLMLVVPDCEKALDFYNRAFSADTIMALRDPNGFIVHAEFKIADTILMMGSLPEMPEESKVFIHLYTEDVEGLLEDVVKAGGEVLSPIKKQFYGDRTCKVRDPFGHVWILATHMEDLTATELQHRLNDLYR